MKTKLLVGLLLAGGSLFAETHVSIGIGVGGYGNGYYPAARPPVIAYATPSPGPGYTWVNGYWYNVGPRRIWRDGYWAPPVYGRREGWRRDYRDRDDRWRRDYRDGDRYDRR